MKNQSASTYLESIRGVLSTTLNPEGPGAVRIHLVPARKGKRNQPAMVVLNGWRIITLKSAWAILLAIFIRKVNKHAGNEVTEIDLNKIVEETVDEMHQIFPRHFKFRFKRDLKEMLGTMIDIAKGEKVKGNIGMSIDDYADRMAGPLRMDLMISAMKKSGHWNCNQKCIYCYAAGQSQAEVPELSTVEWLEIIDKLWNEAYVSQITFTGGEPTRRDDLVDLINHSKRFVTRLNTNGLALEDKVLCKRLYDACLDSVQVTLYSSDPEIHNRLVGISNGFERTVQGIKNALEVGLNVSINTPIVTNNQDYVSTLSFLHELGIIYVTCSGIIHTGNATNEDAEKGELTSEGLTSMLEKAAKYCAENGMELAFTSPGQVSEEVLSKLNLDVPCCGACLSNMAISPNGDVVPCQSWLGADSALGNILESSWEEIWNNQKCQKLKKYVTKNQSTCPFREGFNKRK